MQINLVASQVQGLQKLWSHIPPPLEYIMQVGIRDTKMLGGSVDTALLTHHGLQPPKDVQLREKPPLHPPREGVRHLRYICV